MLYVEVTIDRKKTLPEDTASALSIELNKRLQRKFPDVEATVRLAGMDGLSVRKVRQRTEKLSRRYCRKCGKVRMTGFKYEHQSCYPIQTIRWIYHRLY